MKLTKLAKATVDGQAAGSRFTAPSALPDAALMQPSRSSKAHDATHELQRRTGAEAAVAVQLTLRKDNGGRLKHSPSGNESKRRIWETVRHRSRRCRWSLAAAIGWCHEHRMFNTRQW